MKCERCGAPIDAGEEREYSGQVLCEDCYMDALSPMKSCDPWAVYSAKSFERHSAKGADLAPMQREILRVLEEEGPLEPLELQRKLGGNVSFDELQRQFSVLRHLERVRGEKRGDKVVWRLWD